MNFLIALLTAIVYVVGAFAIFLVVCAFVIIASSLDKIAKAVTKWVDER